MRQKDAFVPSDDLEVPRLIEPNIDDVALPASPSLSVRPLGRSVPRPSLSRGFRSFLRMLARLLSAMSLSVVAVPLVPVVALVPVLTLSALSNDESAEWKDDEDAEEEDVDVVIEGFSTGREGAISPVATAVVLVPSNGASWAG